MLKYLEGGVLYVQNAIHSLYNFSLWIDQAKLRDAYNLAYPSEVHASDKLGDTYYIHNMNDIVGWILQS